jgi:eukaryotic-like serine/threonine-protein kinase
VQRGEAVEAAPPSRIYRFSRLVRRERGLFAGLALAMLVLMIGAGVAVQLSIRATRAERASEQARRVADAVNSFVRTDLLAAVAPTAGSFGPRRDVKMREVLDEASRRMEAAAAPGGNLASEPLVQAGVLEILGETYHALGEFGLAEVHAARAVDVYAGELGEKNVDTLQARLLHARTLRSLGQFQRSYDMYKASRDVLAVTTGAEGPLTLEAEMGMASVASWGIFNFPEAEALYRRVREVRGRTLGPEHPDTLAAAFGIVRMLFFAERYQECLDLATELWEVRRRVMGERNPETLNARWYMARALGEFTPPRYAESEAILVEVLEARKAIYPAEHLAVSACEMDLAEVYLATGRAEITLEMTRRVLDRYQRSFGPDHLDTLAAKGTWGYALAVTGKKEEGVAVLREVLAGYENLPTGGDGGAQFTRDRLKALAELP